MLKWSVAIWILLMTCAGKLKKIYDSWCESFSSPYKKYAGQSSKDFAAFLKKFPGLEVDLSTLK